MYFVHSVLKCLLLLFFFFRIFCLFSCLCIIILTSKILYKDVEKKILCVVVYKFNVEDYVHIDMEIEIQAIHAIWKIKRIWMFSLFLVYDFNVLGLCVKGHRIWNTRSMLKKREVGPLLLLRSRSGFSFSRIPGWGSREKARIEWGDCKSELRRNWKIMIIIKVGTRVTVKKYLSLSLNLAKR